MTCIWIHHFVCCCASVAVHLLSVLSVIYPLLMMYIYCHFTVLLDGLIVALCWITCDVVVALIIIT